MILRRECEAVHPLGVVVNWLGPLGVSVLRDRDGADAGALTLLTTGVIVQFRNGDAPDDSTVKLRPCAATTTSPQCFSGTGPWGRMLSTWTSTAAVSFLFDVIDEGPTAALFEGKRRAGINISVFVARTPPACAVHCTPIRIRKPSSCSRATDAGPPKRRSSRCTQIKCSSCPEHAARLPQHRRRPTADGLDPRVR
ncbi:hypothetical protein EB73_30175 [Mycobacterium sp. SWH-M3]|nr:hypothetical protein EB73_30175 [Mycobacterium sp. SWH-M3]